jgi:hypothetical protein
LSLRQQFSSGREGTASDPPKCERFCTFIIAGQSAEDAYELAGYTPDRRGARRLRARPDVDARIKWLRAQKDGAVRDAKAEIGQAQVTPQWVIDCLAENAEVSLGRRAAANGTYTYNPQAANRALELLGNELGMFEGGSKPEPPVDLDPRGLFTMHRIVNLADPELVMRRAAQLRELGYDDSGKCDHDPLVSLLQSYPGAKR